MKAFKKAIAILLCIAMISAMPVFSSAALFKKKAKAAEETTTEAVVDEAETEAAEEETEAPKAEPKKEKSSLAKKLEKVGTIYLFYSSANPKVPHLWIYIQSSCDESLQIGPYTLEPHGAVSIGAWQDRVGNGAGIYFNLERYWVKEATYGRSFCIKNSLTRGDVARIGNALDRHNYWNWGLNCVFFALSMWTLATPKFVPFLFSPRIALAFMFLYGARRPNFTISKCGASSTYKYITGGSLKNVTASGLFTNYGV